MSADLSKRIRADLEKLRALQPDLTRSQALTFFDKFHRSYPAADVAVVVHRMDLPAVPSPRAQVPKPAPPRSPSAASASVLPRRPAAPLVQPGPPAARPARTSTAKLARSTAIRGGFNDDPPKAVCPECGRAVKTNAKGRVRAHKNGSRACAGPRKRVPGSQEAAAQGALENVARTRRAQFEDHTGVERGILAPSDQDWLNDQGWLIPISSAQPTDVVTARRILLAAGNGHLPNHEARLVHEWYQRMKRRPDLFNPSVPARSWDQNAEGDPSKRLDKPASPGKPVYYREVLVGKRN